MDSTSTNQRTTIRWLFADLLIVNFPHKQVAPTNFRLNKFIFWTGRPYPFSGQSNYQVVIFWTEQLSGGYLPARCSLIIHIASSGAPQLRAN